MKRSADLATYRFISRGISAAMLVLVCTVFATGQGGGRKNPPAPPVNTPKTIRLVALTVITDPPGCSVTVDGRQQKASDFRGQLLLNLAPGSHKLKVSFENHITQERVINLKTAQRESFTLLPILVTVTMLTDPAEAAVYLDGEYKGTSRADGALEIQRLTLGTHQLQVAKKGFFSREETISVAAETRTLRLKLQVDPVAQRIRLIEESARSGRLTDAVKFFEEARNEKSNHPDLAHGLNVIVDSLGKRSQEALQKIGLRGLPVDVDTFRELSLLYKSVQKWRPEDSGVNILATYWELKYVDASQRVAGVQQGETKDTQALLSRLASLSVRNSNILYDLGWIYWDLNDAANAARYFAEAQAIADTWAYPKFGLGMIDLARAEQERDKKQKTSYYTSAISRFNQALVLDPEALHALVFKSIALNSINKEKEAMVTAQAAVGRSPQSAHTQMAMGICLFKKGKSSFAAAKRELESAVTTNFDPLDSWSRALAQRFLMEMSKKK